MKSTEELKKIRSKNNKDLQIELKNDYKKLYDLKFQEEFRKNKDRKTILKTKKHIAQIWTVIRENISKKESPKEK